MAFSINDTGIEDYATGTTQVIFDSPVVIMDRDAETAADGVHDIAISGVPVVVVYGRTQAKSFLRIYVRYITGSNLANLRTLMASGELVKAKLEPGSATTIACMFGPRADQRLTSWTGDHAEAQSDGSALDPVLIQYKAELLLLRME